jgi:hypothetical protein
MALMTEENQEKKIIVDEDWKSQVEAEKEALRRREEAAQTESETEAHPEVAAEGTTATGTEAAGAADAEDFELPPASFPMLVTSFATQALTAMGQVPDPIDGKTAVRLPVARHLVDSLAVLEEKTRGNLTAEEERMLGDVLHQLRMTFVAVQNMAAGAKPADDTGGPDDA